MCGHDEYLKEIIGKPITEIETPALMVDLDIMEANMDKMMDFLRDSGPAWESGPTQRPTRRPKSP